MNYLEPGQAFVSICDWRGKIVWLSTPNVYTKVGDNAWDNVHDDDKAMFWEHVARVATLGERQQFSVASQQGTRYRIWLWPLGNPELAVCGFALQIPPETGSLTERDNQYMRLLATGQSPKEIAAELDVSLNTVHSQLRKIREKLDQPDLDKLISYAARFFHTGQSGETFCPEDALNWDTEPAETESTKAPAKGED